MNKFESIIYENRNRILLDFVDSIFISMFEATRLSLKKTEEPDFVAMLVKHGTRLIANALHKVIKPHGISLKVSSVFCHQKPIVSFDKSNNETCACEIGDVLIAHIHNDGKYQKKMALLLQAKMVENIPFYIDKLNNPQYYLYHHWPIFTYKRSIKHLKGKKRNICPKGYHLGAQYLLIGNIDNLMYCQSADMDIGCMAVSLSNNPLWPSRSLAEEILLLMMGVSGRSWDDSNNSLGWSQLIRDLLYMGAVSVFNRRNVGLNGQRRKSTFFLSFFSKHDEKELMESRNYLAVAQNFLVSSGYNGGDFILTDEEVMDENHSGVSIILIQTGDE
ncbi:hypothetical protein [Tepidiphilus baoligensis]|uniref:Uncharacterized protein n=1 Tax=Tepidiphilus baoligensis TaxID=2698687 RepID=A0ABX1QNE5_9PROT|nr:hypothetical protein [Tepidiphilus baoligensis]NMH16585.1 hypothetical protein [Tepidiphilus baoligensis]